MKNMLRISAMHLVVLFMLLSGNAFARILPSATYKFAERDTCDLYMDIYYPRQIDAGKPVLLYVFGGGFMTGARNAAENLPYYSALTERGYTVVAIDYRLGLKGVKKMGVGQVGLLRKAIDMAVEDLYSATSFLVEHSSELKIDADNIVLIGSSAGAITSLQADYEICNASPLAENLPDGFRYAGVVSYSGAVLSFDGKVKYREKAPSPTFFLHGTADRLVPYKQIEFFNMGFYGSDKLARRFEKYGYPYCIVRYRDYTHEIASTMVYSVDELEWFIENMVSGGKKIRKDVTVLSDPSVPRLKAASNSPKELYGKDGSNE